MQIAVSADHGGFALKSEIVALLKKLGHDVADLGAHQMDPLDDYPDYARYVAQAIQNGNADRGIVICGSGIGACVAANKHKGIRAGVCHDTYSAHQAVEHDDMNVLCLGARVVGGAVAAELVKAFVGAQFVPEPKYVRRLEKVNAMELAGFKK